MRGVASQAAGSARAPVAVVGGGLTGAAAAAALTKAGLSVHVYDMGRQPGEHSRFSSLDVPMSTAECSQPHKQPCECGLQQHFQSSFS